MPARVQVTELAVPGGSAGDLARDVVRGFAGCPRWLPPKYFYDPDGAHLFDAICETPEYYLTRAEQGLLEQVAGPVVDAAGADVLVELGSGAARKTRTLLDAMMRRGGPVTYVPVDISRDMLVAASTRLLDELPGLRVHALVADFDHHLHLLPRGGRRLIAFLGSSIGNFRQPRAIRFLAALARGLEADDRLLIGYDLVKAPGVLHAAYNDAAGITAEFNRNVLRVINRELGGDFEVAAFEHRADYLEERAQIEMYLVARGSQEVRLRRLDRRYRFAAGERIRTEISRKFVRADVDAMTAAAGLAVADWHVSADGAFALAVVGPAQ
ncbi:MAG TPA: L-histidine N(alpha)-methyltransferase [Kofleriaceae bacterium]|nr:L-histidine N(alpha)-methyltransferase [Kofleriaceae bacterium]